MIEEQAAFEAWAERVCPSGDVDSVNSQWLSSIDYREWCEDRAEGADPKFNTPSFEQWLARVRSEVEDNATLVMRPNYLVIPYSLHNGALWILINLHRRQVRTRRRGVRGRAYSLKWSKP